jgi:hypothetical protein
VRADDVGVGWVVDVVIHIDVVVETVVAVGNGERNHIRKCTHNKVSFKLSRVANFTCRGRM